MNRAYLSERVKICIVSAPPAEARDHRELSLPLLSLLVLTIGIRFIGNCAMRILSVVWSHTAARGAAAGWCLAWWAAPRAGGRARNATFRRRDHSASRGRLVSHSSTPVEAVLGLAPDLNHKAMAHSGGDRRHIVRLLRVEQDAVATFHLMVHRLARRCIWR